MNGITRKIVKAYPSCVLFSFLLFIIVWLSEILREVMLDMSSGWSSGIPILMGYSVLIFFAFVFGIVPLVVWGLGEKMRKALLGAFNIDEELLEKKKEKTDGPQLEKIERSEMSEDAKRQQDREFQCDLTKLQVDFEFSFTMVIGVMAILYGLLSVYKDNLTLVVVIDILLFVAFVSLLAIYYKKETRFQEIRKKYRLFTSHDSKTP